MNINFYQTNDILHKSIAPILMKILEERKRALIFCQNPELLQQIDEGLWSFSKTKFVPHGTSQDRIEPEDQPIFLTDKEENINDSQYLIMLDKASEDFIGKFEKSFYFFGENNLQESKILWRHYKAKSANLNFYKKEQDKWVVVQ